MVTRIAANAFPSCVLYRTVKPLLKGYNLSSTTQPLSHAFILLNPFTGANSHEFPYTSSFDIATVTSKGVVQLSGFVNNQGQIDQALKLTRAVEGVQSVVSQMSIKK